METNKPTSILFVCLGNICRSPAAEAIFNALIEQQGLKDHYLVDSAGMGGWHAGQRSDRRMISHATARGLRMDHLARQVKVSDFERFDIILAMDDSNYDELQALAPTVASSLKIHRMVAYSQRYTADHIPDPYYSGSEGFELVLDLLEDSCEGLLSQIR